MDTPIEEQQMFQNVTCNVAASEDEINEPNTLSVDFINYVSFIHFHLYNLFKPFSHVDSRKWTMAFF